MAQMVKNLPATFGRSPAEGDGYPLQYSYLENSKDSGVWQVTVHGAAENSDATEQLTLSNRNISRDKNIIYKELKINNSHNYFAVHNFLLISVKKETPLDFPNGWVVRTLCFHCRDRGRIPAQGMPCGTAKKKKNHDIICVNLLSKPFKSM